MSGLTWRSLGLLTASGLVSYGALAAPLPTHVSGAVQRAVESEYVIVNALAAEAQFIRYDVTGQLEPFHCRANSTFVFDLFHASQGRFTVGVCSKGSLLDENMGEQQAKGLQAAFLAAQGRLDNIRNTLRDVIPPQVVVDEQGTYIHLIQPLVSRSGEGGFGGFLGAVETLLLIPPQSKTVVLVQGALPPNACAPTSALPALPLCADFRAVLREVSRKVYAAQAAPPPPRAFMLEPVPPGQPTICDSVAWTVAEALEQSEVRGISVTETVRYKQHAGQPDIQRNMRDAAGARAKGTSISVAATRVGRQCYEEHFSKK